MQTDKISSQRSEEIGIFWSTVTFFRVAFGQFKSYCIILTKRSEQSQEKQMNNSNQFKLRTLSHAITILLAATAAANAVAQQ